MAWKYGMEIEYFISVCCITVVLLFLHVRVPKVIPSKVMQMCGSRIMWCTEVRKYKSSKVRTKVLSKVRKYIHCSTISQLATKVLSQLASQLASSRAIYYLLPQLELVYSSALYSYGHDKPIGSIVDQNSCSCTVQRTVRCTSGSTKVREYFHTKVLYTYTVGLYEYLLPKVHVLSKRSCNNREGQRLTRRQFATISNYVVALELHFILRAWDTHPDQSTQENCGWRELLVF